MAMAGRRLKPTALKVLEGDRDKRRREVPGLAAARSEKGMEAAGGFNGSQGHTDHGRPDRLRRVYVRWREAEDFITQHGSIFKTPSDYVQQISIASRT